MKKLKIKGKEYQLRTKGSEVTLGELSKISGILNGQTKDFTEKWLEVLEILGSTELVDVIGVNDFTKAVKDVQITDVKNKIIPTIEVNGRTYTIALDNGKIDLSARELSALTKLANNNEVWGHKAFALLYKDDQLTPTEHKDEAHIKHKSDLFSKHVMADVASPVIFQLGQIIIENVKNLVDAQSMAVSRD